MKAPIRPLRHLVLLVIGLALCLAAPAGALADEPSGPTLGFTHVPAYGTDEYLTGEVQAPNGEALDPSAYHVTLYVQINASQQCWVKPTERTPYVDVLADGSFALDCGIMSTDKTATYLHVLLVPAYYTPTLHGLDEAKSKAYDYVKITRAEDGTYTMDPAGRELASPSKPSGLAVSDAKIAVGVGLYTSGAPGDTVSDDRIRQLLSRTATFADTVRFYCSVGPEYRACQIASSELGLKVVGTAQLVGNATQDQAEMDALVELCNAGYVQVACVGNETLYSGRLTPEALVADIAAVRSRLTVDIPVTTSETLGLLLGNPLVRNACDILMPNTYPFWERVPVDDAMDTFRTSLENLRNSSPGKEIVVSETGWPTDGGNNGSAVTGEAQSRSFFDGVRQWSLDTQTVVLWFDAADEPWKSGTGGEGSVGAHWGLMDKDLRIKEGFRDLDLFAPLAGTSCATPAISKVENVKGGMKLTWKKVSGARAYRVFCKVGSGNWKKVADTTSTSYTAKTSDGTTALRTGTKYAFAVRCVSGVGSDVYHSKRSAAKAQVFVASTAISSAKSASAKKATIRWKKVASSSGYVLQYSTKKNFASAKTLTVKGGTKVATTVKGLVGGKTYYVRVRTYRTASGKKYYAAWSARTSVKVKR